MKVSGLGFLCPGHVIPRKHFASIIVDGQPVSLKLLVHSFLIKFDVT